MSNFVMHLIHLSYFLVSLENDNICLKIIFGGQHCKKSRSHEHRHQSDTVCHNIFDYYTCESTRHPVNMPEIDKIMPYHQASGSSIVEHLVRKEKSAVPYEEATTTRLSLSDSSRKF